MKSFMSVIMALAFACTLLSTALTSPLATDSNEFIQLKSALDSRADTTDSAAPKPKICVDVCDRTGCHKNLCAEEAACSEATRDLSMPITWINVPKGDYCDVFNHLDCGGARETIVGVQPQHKLMHTYHTYACWRGDPNHPSWAPKEVVPPAL